MKLLVNDDIIKGLYLLLTILIGGEIVDTFSKQGLNLIKNNVIAKYTIILSTIYFTLDYSNTKIQHPIYTIYTSLAIFILYLLFSRQDIYFTICLFLLLSALYILIDLKIFYEYEDNNKGNNINKESIDKIDTSILILSYAMIAILIIGYIKYFIYQRNKRGKGFKTLKFILGSKI
tara:strand:+ start:1937 stop:2464 length:528 start_codon:yes stop_codon:yes gene_type:complete